MAAVITTYSQRPALESLAWTTIGLCAFSSSLFFQTKKQLDKKTYEAGTLKRARVVSVGSSIYNESDGFRLTVKLDTDVSIVLLTKNVSASEVWSAGDQRLVLCHQNNFIIM